MGKIVEALSCLNCGSNDLPYENGFLVCSYCHTKHILVNNNLVRVFEKHELYDTADLYLKWNQYDVACEKYKEIVYKWAKEAMAWWGIVRCMTENLSKVDISKEHLEEVKKYAERAFRTADTQTKAKLESRWDQYSKEVLELINEKKKKEEKKTNQETLRKQVEEMKRNAYNAFIKMKAQEEKRVSGIITAISVLVLIITNIAYISLIISLNIPNSIYSSPACIGPVVIGGFIAMPLVGLSSGISKFFGLFWVPAATNAVSVIMMISGMISHSPGFFVSLMVVVCFGAVGTGVTALIGWLSWLITCGMNDNYNSDYFAKKYVNYKFKEPQY